MIHRKRCSSASGLVTKCYNEWPQRHCLTGYSDGEKTEVERALQRDRVQEEATRIIGNTINHVARKLKELASTRRQSMLKIMPDADCFTNEHEMRACTKSKR
jgi:hypothetical protein